MKRHITTMLTAAQAKAIVNGVEAALDFGIDYYMFAPGARGYNTGHTRKNDKMIKDTQSALTKLRNALCSAGHGVSVRY